MPVKNKTKSTHRKRVHKKKHKKSKLVVSQTSTISRYCTMFPDIFRTKLKVVTNGSYDPFAGALFTFQTPLYLQFKGNSCSSCGPQTNISGGYLPSVPDGLIHLLGSQSNYGDVGTRANGVYANARVIASAIHCSFVPQNNTTIPLVAGTLGQTSIDVANQGYLITLLPTTTATSSMTLTTGYLQELPYAKCLTIPQLNTSGKPLIIGHKMTTQKMFGLRYKSLLEAKEYAIDEVGVTPTLPWFWQLTIHNANTSTNSQWVNMAVHIEIEYTVEFFNRNNISTQATY